MTRTLAILGACVMLSCGAGPAKRVAAPPPLPPSGSVYRVVDAVGRTFVVLGPAASAPTQRGRPELVGPGKSLEVADREELSPAPELTVIDTTGACITTAGHGVKLGGDGGWLSAFELDGCRGDPARQRLALVGAIGDARWVAPNVELTADGKPVPTSEFFEGGSRGQDMRWSARVPGLNLEFERHWLAPERDAAVTRVRENGKVLAAYRAELEGAVHAGQRWLFVFTSARERSVLELQGNVFLPVLGPEPETASLTEPAVEAKPTPGPDFAAMGGNVRVTRAPSAGKSIQVTVKGVSREAERLTFQLDGGRVLQLSTPPELPSPVAAGDALVLEILAHGGGPNRRHHVVARSPEGELVFEVGSSSSKAKDFSVTRGAERMAQPEGDRVRHDYRVRFEHAGSSVEVEPGSFSRLDAKYVVWGSATRQELGKGKKRPPDFVESWLDFAVFRLP